MKYFIDTEFLEGEQEQRIFGFKTGRKTKPTIDLISIGIVAEDGREYYAISKEFNIDEAWYRYQNSVDWKEGVGHETRYPWIRNNVLLPIFNEICTNFSFDLEFNIKNFKKLIALEGKSRDTIKSEIQDFVSNWKEVIVNGTPKMVSDFYSNSKWVGIKDVNPGIWSYIDSYKDIVADRPEFYAYYADYDWVGFCWIFGLMIDLPKGYPKFCMDLQQMKVDKINKIRFNQNDAVWNFKYTESWLKSHPMYRRQDPRKLHNALEDARWNKELYDFLTLKKL